MRGKSRKQLLCREKQVLLHRWREAEIEDETITTHLGSWWGEERRAELLPRLFNIDHFVALAEFVLVIRDDDADA